VIGFLGFWVFVFLFVVHPLFHPCRGRLTFFVLPKKVSKERRARCGEPLLEFVSQGGEGKNSLRSDSFPSFFLLATQIQGAA
jgi:hypothetical protein